MRTIQVMKDWKMNRENILKEIKRIAAANGGRAPGRLQFESETGVRVSDWRGRLWVRWNDAIREAGLIPNQKNIAYDEAFLIEKFISLMREQGHFPVFSELRFKATSDPEFPSDSTYRKFGRKSQLIALVLNYCNGRSGYEDIILFCKSALDSSEADLEEEQDSAETEVGFVYLLKSGRYYKIGRSNSAGRREYELTIQLPEKANTVHAIRTDDPVGIEAYWHKRFASKRKNGEWFALSSQDVSAFRKRKLM